jgi:hypothetical protein
METEKIIQLTVSYGNEVTHYLVCSDWIMGYVTCEYILERGEWFSIKTTDGTLFRISKNYVVHYEYKKE